MRTPVGPPPFPRDVDPDLGLAGSDAAVATIAMLVLVAGAALAVLRFVGGTPAEQGFEGVLGSVALGAVVAAPGLLALLGLLDRPVLLLPAAVVLVPLSFLSFALVTLPLVIPASVLFVAYGRRSPYGPVRPGWAAPITVSVIGLLVAAVVALFLNQDAREYSTVTTSGSTSDVITAAEALLSLALTASAVAGGWWLSSPAPARPADPGPERADRTRRGGAVASQPGDRPVGTVRGERSRPWSIGNWAAPA